jgi:hypothetical protein
MRSFLTRHYKITISLFILPSIIILAQDIGYKEIGMIRSDLLNEISGIVQGRLNPDVFWVHNDSGDKSYIYAIDRSGYLLGKYRLENARNRDWEDIAAGPGPVKGINYLYIGEIGDNEAEYSIKTVYRVPEPLVPASGTMIDTILTDCTPISFTYPDGPRDAECLLVDPENADIYVLSKRDAQTHIYHAPYPQPIDTVFQIQLLGTIGVSGLTAGDISADGRYIILKNYTEVFVWQRAAGASLFEAITRPPERLPYIPEPQGESIAWDIDGKGYITTSEVVGGIPARLIHYNFVPVK